MQLAIVLAVTLIFILALVGGLKIIERDRRPAGEQLKQRFARGDIGEGEYLRSLAILEHGSELVVETERVRLRGEPRTGDS